MRGAPGSGIAPASSVTSPTRHVLRSRRVLVIEDNLDAVHTIAFLLKSDGHVVDFAINGIVALEIARTFRPEVVVLDLGLPGLDGFEVCSRLKSDPILSQARVLVVSAHYTDDDRVRARAAGCDAHIPKPYDPQDLLEAIRDA